jgi:hypothetical protein|tara:strand:+ start:223 stop:444 length:222 start_codon:yes stop_codon:yes gene_type:complete
MEIQIGRRGYTVESTYSKVNNWGQPQVWTNLKGKNGADVVLCETTSENGVSAKLIHMGRRSPLETIDPSLIKR